MSNCSISAPEATRSGQQTADLYASTAFATECSQTGQACVTAESYDTNAASAASDTYTPQIHPRFETISSANQEKTREERAVKALDTASDGEKLLKPDPQLPRNLTPERIDKCLAYAEKWWSNTMDFFADPGVTRYLSSDELAEAQSALQSYQTGIADFKAVLEDYRSRGEQPPLNILKAAFYSMRSLRRALKFTVAVVVVRSIQAFEQAIYGCLLERSYSNYASSIVDSTAVLWDFQLILNDIAMQTHNEARNDRMSALLRWALFLLRQNRTGGDSAL